MSMTAYYVERGTPRLYGFVPVPSTVLSGASNCDIEYLNEGGANFVFTLHPGDDELPARLKGKLLRLRKDLPHVPSASDQLRALDENFNGLFPAENVIEHELISLDQSIPNELNAFLRKMIRPRHRAGDFLPSEDIAGLLVTDMTAKPGETLLQLKPKWLTQSPNAPPEARRCRTCAIRAQRASEHLRTATDAQASCPLDLVNINKEERKRAAHALTSDQRLRDFIVDQAQPLLQQLRACQLAFDSQGILKTCGSEQIRNLCKAMTLRDCTLFVKRAGNTIEARLGDLDLKQPQKLPRWKKVEQLLISGGWYANKEEKSLWTPEEICVLSRAG